MYRRGMADGAMARRGPGSGHLYGSTPIPSDGSTQTHTDKTHGPYLVYPRSMVYPIYGLSKVPVMGG